MLKTEGNVSVRRTEVVQRLRCDAASASYQQNNLANPRHASPACFVYSDHDRAENYTLRFGQNPRVIIA